MLATELDAAVVGTAAPACIESATQVAPTNDLATARGFALGMAIGALCLLVVGCAVWWMA